MTTETVTEAGVRYVCVDGMARLPAFSHASIAGGVIQGATPPLLARPIQLPIILVSLCKVVMVAEETRLLLSKVGKMTPYYV